MYDRIRHKYIRVRCTMASPRGVATTQLRSPSSPPLRVELTVFTYSCTVWWMAWWDRCSTWVELQMICCAMAFYREKHGERSSRWKQISTVGFQVRLCRKVLYFREKSRETSRKYTLSCIGNWSTAWFLFLSGFCHLSPSMN